MKTVLAVSSNTAASRKSVALARGAAQAANDGDNTVTVVNKAGEPFKVLLNG